MIETFAPGTGGAPSRLHVNGAVPDNAVAVIVPLDAPGHDVAVLVVLPFIPGPAGTFALNALIQPRLSVILTTWAPADTLIKV